MCFLTKEQLWLWRSEQLLSSINLLQQLQLLNLITEFSENKISGFEAFLLFYIFKVFVACSNKFLQFFEETLFDVDTFLSSLYLYFLRFFFILFSLFFGFFSSVSIYLSFFFPNMEIEFSNFQVRKFCNKRSSQASRKSWGTRVRQKIIFLFLFLRNMLRYVSYFKPSNWQILSYRL